jgi:hypothetical protein
MSTGPYRYTRGGLLIESDWPLRGVAAAAPALAGLGYFSIRRGAVPDLLPGGVVVDSITQAAPGQLLLVHPKAGRFLARAGGEILVEPVGEDLGDLETFILGSGFAAICIQKGLVVLHASAIEVDGCAIAFAGASGAGKSTLLGALVAAGYAPIADDLSLIQFNTDLRPHIFPAVGYLRLWPDSVNALGLGGHSSKPEVSWSAKVQLPLDRIVSRHSWPLAAIFLLARGETDLTAEQLETPAASIGLAQQLFRIQYIHALGQLAALLPQLGEIAAAKLIYRLRYPSSYETLPAVIETVRQTIHTKAE